MDARINTADNPSMTVNNLVNFGSVIPEFCRCVYNNNTNKHICIAIGS